MRVARVVACASSSSVATRICIDASVCCRRARESTDGAAELWIEYGTFRACAGTPAAPVAVVQVGGVASDLPAPCTTGASCCSTATGFGELEPMMPCTTATETAIPTAAGSATSTSRRDGRFNRRGFGSSANTRSRRDSGACGACARSKASTVRSFADIVHPLFQASQRATQPRRARCLADPEHARCARAVKLEQDAQRHHFTLGRRQLAQRSLERFRQSFAELLD